MISTLLFDFGDVFLNLDKSATQRQLERLDIKCFSEQQLLHNQQYEKGLITSEDFIQVYLEQYPHVTESDFTQCWNAILLDFPPHRLEFLKRLAKEGKYQLILLSNTNDIHINWVKKNIPFFEEFSACFDAMYLSQEINFRKPDASIYEFVLRTHGLQPQEILFIDDTAENTRSAAAMGFHTWNIDPAKEDVVDLFEHKKELF